MLRAVVNATPLPPPTFNQAEPVATLPGKVEAKVVRTLRQRVFSFRWAVTYLLEGP